jgi:hypothetical protein
MYVLITSYAYVLGVDNAGCLLISGGYNYFVRKKKFRVDKGN